MHTHFRAFSRKFFEKKFYPSLIWNWEVETHPVFTKNLKNILFDCGTAYFTYLKSPFTYLEFERQNATCFLEKTENFFEKAVYLKNIPSLVPTGRGHLGIVIPKKGKKICPPDMAGVFVFAWRRQHGLFIINR